MRPAPSIGLPKNPVNHQARREPPRRLESDLLRELRQMRHGRIRASGSARDASQEMSKCTVWRIFCGTGTPNAPDIASPLPRYVCAHNDDEPDNDYTATPPTTQIGGLICLSLGGQRHNGSERRHLSARDLSTRALINDHWRLRCPLLLAALPADDLQRTPNRSAQLLQAGRNLPDLVVALIEEPLAHIALAEARGVL